MENLGPLSSPKLKGYLQTYGKYLADIRKRIIFILISFAASTIVGFIFYEQIIRFLIGILSLKGINIVFTSPFQFINLAISCGIATGIIISFPLLIYEIFSFLKPALSKNEFKTITKYLPFSLFLFIIGFCFGVLIMRWQIDIFLGRSVSLGIGNILDISSLLSVVLLTSALMGVGFQFPIVLLLLLKFGIIHRESLSKIRKWVYLGSVIFAILLPPDSILADVLLSLPLIILFEVTLLMAPKRNFG